MVSWVKLRFYLYWIVKRLVWLIVDMQFYLFNVSEEVVHKEEKSITATLNKATTSIKISESFNNKIKSDNEKVSNIKEKTNEEMSNQSEKKMIKSEIKTNKAKATEKGSSSKSQESKLTVSSKKSATFVKDSTAESTKR